jgi:hypothetical protein
MRAFLLISKQGPILRLDCTHGTEIKEEPIYLHHFDLVLYTLHTPNRSKQLDISRIHGSGLGESRLCVYTFRHYIFRGGFHSAMSSATVMTSIEPAPNTFICSASLIRRNRNSIYSSRKLGTLGCMQCRRLQTEILPFICDERGTTNQKIKINKKKECRHLTGNSIDCVTKSHLLAFASDGPFNPI